MAKKGRPSDFTQEYADLICERIANGASMRAACKDADMPGLASVFQWLRLYPEFAEQYARATKERSEAMAEEIMDISDDGTNDWMEDQYMKGKTPGWKVNGEAVQRSKLRVETRKWLMSKMIPKKYGDKVDVTSDGKAIEGNTIILKDFNAPSSK